MAELRCVFVRAEMVCPHLDAPANGALDSTDVSIGVVITASCEPGFMFPDRNLTERLECVSDGAPQPEAVWNAPVRDCQRLYITYD